MLNRLDKRFSLQTQEISKALGRGKHTTRHTELYQVAGGWLADTPGFSPLISRIDSKLLIEKLKDFRVDDSCRFNDCQHINEPDCAVKRGGRWHRSSLRYKNYLDVVPCAPKKGMGIMIIVSPSLLSANLNLEKDIEMFNKSNAQWLHYDVMMEWFQYFFWSQILEQVCKITDKFIDVHIMVANPLKVVDYFDKARVNMLTFHYEAVKDLEELNAVIDKIHAKGIKAAVSIKPNTCRSIRAVYAS